MTGAWLWLYGPPGVGKSAAGFRLFQRLAERGERLAFVEIDQIGMCMPAPVEARSAAKAENLLAVLDNFAAAGAAGVIVSGDIVETMHDVLDRTQTRPALCRLRADDEVTIERLTERGGLQYAMSSKTYESFDVPAGEIDVTTHGSLDEVVDEILRGLGAWPSAIHASAAQEARPVTPIVDVDVILITGPRSVGTSTVAWQVLMESIATGRRSGFLDLDQLAFLSCAGREKRLAAMLANLSVCWAGFREQSAERLVLCGHADDNDVSALCELFPTLRIVGLSATVDTLLERSRRRARSPALALPGDDLYGRPDDYLRSIVHATEALVPDSADLTLETDTLTPTDVATKIGSIWPSTE